jgi:hypothetical protein
MVVSEKIVTIDIKNAGQGNRVSTDFAGTNTERNNERGKVLDCAIPGIVEGRRSGSSGEIKRGV